MGRRVAAVGAALLFAVPVLSGCGAEREYAIPDKFCEVRVDPSLTGSFLPPGKKLTQKKSRYAPFQGTEGCSMYVDGKVVLSMRGEWHSAGYTAKDAANAAIVPGADEIQRGKYALWNYGASAAIECTAPAKVLSRIDPGEGVPEIFAFEVHVPQQEEGTRAAMRKFIGPYAKALKETLPCQGD